MQTSQKKDIPDPFREMLVSSPSTIFFSEDLRETVETILQKAASEDELFCKIRAGEAHLVGSILTIKSSRKKIKIKIYADTVDAWKILTSIGNVDFVAIGADDSLMSSYDISAASIKREHASSRCIMSICLSKR